MSKRDREERRAAKRAASEAPIPEPTETFETTEEANEALADTARVLNMANRNQQAARKTEEADRPTRLTKDGRVALPPLPKGAGKPKPMHPCECGCGNLTKSRFYPGHDSRLRGWMLRVERDLVKLSDIPDGEREAVAAALKRKRAAAKKQEAEQHEAEQQEGAGA